MRPPAATACLGAGFGLVVSALNTLTAVYRPDAVDRAVPVLTAPPGRRRAAGAKPA